MGSKCKDWDQRYGPVIIKAENTGSKPSRLPRIVYGAKESWFF